MGSTSWILAAPRRVWSLSACYKEKSKISPIPFFFFFVVEARISSLLSIPGSIFLLLFSSSSTNIPPAIDPNIQFFHPLRITPKPKARARYVR